MGKLKLRLTTMITADLLQWRRLNQNTFQGVTWNSVDQEWPDNHALSIRFIDVTYYPHIRGFWEEHWVGRTIQGNYFRMEEKHQIKVKS